MPTSTRSLRTDVLKSISYDDTKPAKPPLPITVAPSPSSSRLGVHPSLRPKTSPEPSQSTLAVQPASQEDERRDSGLAPSSYTARESRTTLATDKESVASLNHSPSLPRLNGHGEPARSLGGKTRKWSGYKSKRVEDFPQMPEMPFTKITTDIPTSSFEDLTAPGKVEFSNRGSMLIGGKRANELNGELNGGSVMNGHRRHRSKSNTAPSLVTSSRVLSVDEEILSQKVRSMYDSGIDKEMGRNMSSPGAPNDGRIEEEPVVVESMRGEQSRSDNVSDTAPSGITKDRVSSLSTTLNSQRESLIQREVHELAGGFEDWEDVDSGDVDRYGFIVPRRIPSNTLSPNQKAQSPDPPRIQRVSTSLQIASDAPRRQRSKMSRAASTNGPKLPPMRKTSGRPPSSQGSYQSTHGGHNSMMRSATNNLPHNKDRRWKDEAGDMLTLPPGLADLAEHDDGGKLAIQLKRRELEREEKWRKMGTVVKTNRVGGGMIFEFDTKSPKLIERTWKGIPDRWRASAWHAFITASAKKCKDSPSDETLIATFQDLVEQGSPDDVQIDIDVPRTINSHIMFRRRYRGGQRLLFRVLHCLSIYFPDTGYVQGMAALAATLLCYYDEEMTFVMLVRLWQLRGLARLYQSGFEGLMDALEEFEKKWLAGGEIAGKLNELNITPTAYGTRWYLTLFNYSIPFPAQLRVWDVFMLLGDANPSPFLSPSTSSDFTSTTTTPINGALDVLHATSAALIDGTRDILLDSDFENSMKVLTSWIPIRDEDLLMRVARAEWKLHRKKK